jgi:hypothetical protein
VRLRAANVAQPNPLEKWIDHHVKYLAKKLSLCPRLCPHNRLSSHHWASTLVGLMALGCRDLDERSSSATTGHRPQAPSTAVAQRQGVRASARPAQQHRRAVAGHRGGSRSEAGVFCVFLDLAGAHAPHAGIAAVGVHRRAPVSTALVTALAASLDVARGAGGGFGGADHIFGVLVRNDHKEYSCRSALCFSCC